jgi:hypothetical protein
MSALHRIYARVSPHFRRRRLQLFRKRLRVGPAETLPDVAGYPACWADPAWPNPITLLNRSFPTGLERLQPAFTYVAGDGCALPFADGQFQILFRTASLSTWGPGSGSRPSPPGPHAWVGSSGFTPRARISGRTAPARPIHPLAAGQLVGRLIRNFTPWVWVNGPPPPKSINFSPRCDC